MKKIISSLAILSISFLAFSFEWPVEMTKVESIKSFFGQFRGGQVSTSLLIEKPETKKDEELKIQEVRASEEGQILTFIYAIDDDNDFFPSTLGNAIIISHSDNIISVYGNLEYESLSNSSDLIEDNPAVTKETIIGQSGNSAWREKNSGLDFGIIDTKNKTAINPRLLLPRIEKEGTFPPTEIIMEGRDGKRYDISSNRTFLSGSYKFYQKRNDNLVPFKITLSVNGVVADEYSFDVVVQEENKIFVNGKSKKYPGKVIYPDDKLFFAGETRLTPGKSVLTFENTNHLGEKRLANYNVTVY